MQRLSTHKSSPWFKSIANVTIDHYSDRASASAAELVAIQTERPIHNRTHSKKKSICGAVMPCEAAATLSSALARVTNITLFAARYDLPARTLWRVLRGDSARRGTLALIESALKKERVL
jgi:predicted transcriptional regulator